MMDAGVPLPRPVAGIAMGLIKEGERFAVLSDILGDEDHLGDMDFKVAGTEQGITSLQMDIKITSITEGIMKQALAQAKDGRIHILGEMSKALQGARDGVSSNAPRIVTIKINKDRIRDVIGSGGKVIREICEMSGAKIDIEEDGTIRVAAVGEDSIKNAISRIMAVASDPEIGQIYDGTVTRLLEFGAIVQFFGAKDGMVHISEMRPERVAKVTDVVRAGQKVRVKLMAIEAGKMKLSMKNIPQGDAPANDSGDDDDAMTA
jgi:polyribonucleotide nucleotidyltransferase